MKIKIQLQHPNAKAPTYATDGSGDFDLYAASVNGMDHVGDVCYPGHPVVCDIGVAFEFPPGHVLAIKSRSGLFFKHEIMAFPGEIDSDFTGSVKVKLVCLHADDDEPPMKINPGDRIAQARIEIAPRCEFEVVEQLTITERGDGGFGSTGAA